MNTQEQNKDKGSYQGQATTAPGVQKNEAPKQPPVVNAMPGAKPADKDAADKDASSCSTTKGSCGTK